MNKETYESLYKEDCAAREAKTNKAKEIGERGNPIERRYVQTGDSYTRITPQFEVLVLAWQGADPEFIRRSIGFGPELFYYIYDGYLDNPLPLLKQMYLKKLMDTVGKGEKDSCQAMEILYKLLYESSPVEELMSEDNTFKKRVKELYQKAKTTIEEDKA